MALGAGCSFHRRTETMASLDPWQPLFLLVVPGGPPVRYVCPCWCISGGRWQSCGDQAGSRSQLGVDSFIFSVGFLAFALPLCWRIILLQFSFEEDGDHGGVLGEGAVRFVLPLLVAKWGLTSSPVLGYASDSSVSMPARVDDSA